MARLYNNNMYRVLNIMCFGDSAPAVFKLCQPGVVMALIAPKFMPAKGEESLWSYAIDSEQSFLQIGYSFDYDICKGQDSNPRTPAVKAQCYTFVNKAVEKLCDRHKLQVEQQALARVKGSRMNLISNNVDINAIKMRQKLDFGQSGVGVLRRDNRPLDNMTVEEKAKHLRQKQEGQQQLQSFINRRANLAEKRAPIIPAAVQTIEKQVLNAPLAEDKSDEESGLEFEDEEEQASNNLKSVLGQKQSFEKRFGA
jgi:hypothetical protein